MEVCEAIICKLEKTYLQVPGRTKEWENVASEFYSQWNFPNYLGAVDGKHVQIIPPPNCGSLFYNYKHFNSIVLMALVDANYKFLFVDVGSYGRISDGGVFNSCSLSAALDNNQLNIPTDIKLPGSDIVCPYVIVADDAFAMRRHLVKPFSMRNLTYEQRIFNYRLSRARRVVENAFGIMCSKFRVFSKAIPLVPEKVQTVVMTTCCLHNFLLRNPTSTSHYLSDTADPSCDLKPVAKERVYRASNEALAVRANFMQYFNSTDGAVSWQANSVS